MARFWNKPRRARRARRPEKINIQAGSPTNGEASSPKNAHLFAMPAVFAVVHKSLLLTLLQLRMLGQFVAEFVPQRGVGVEQGPRLVAERLALPDVHFAREDLLVDFRPRLEDAAEGFGMLSMSMGRGKKSARFAKLERPFALVKMQVPAPVSIDDSGDHDAEEAGQEKFSTQPGCDERERED